MLNALRNVMKDETGQGMTEYVLVISLVALGSILAFGLFRDALVNRISTAADSLTNAN